MWDPPRLATCTTPHDRAAFRTRPDWTALDRTGLDWTAHSITVLRRERGTEDRLGQCWHPTSKAKSKAEKTKQVVETSDEGEWRDLPEDELARVEDGLKTAFWTRATHEQQPDGAWIAVKAILR